MSDFVGPCVHGRDPYTRCEDGCENLTPDEAEVDFLRERIKVLENIEFIRTSVEVIDAAERSAYRRDIENYKNTIEGLELSLKNKIRSRNRWRRIASWRLKFMRLFWRD